MAPVRPKRCMRMFSEGRGCFSFAVVRVSRIGSMLGFTEDQE